MVCVPLGTMVVDSDSSWDTLKPNWYSVSINIKSLEEYEELMKWIKGIPAYHKHTVFRITDYSAGKNNFFIEFDIRFRYERDYEWFTLRWS